VELDLSTYDRSCNVDSDCIAVQTGMLCPDTCPCANSAVSVFEQVRYSAARAQVTLSSPLQCTGCLAAAAGPRCSRGQCALGR
jgi:hypothetical protein